MFRWRIRGPAAGIAVLALLGCVCSRPVPVAAHAVLAQSDPPAQAVLQQAPGRVQLAFTEAIEPNSIAITVVDAARQVVDSGDGRIASGTDATLIATLKPDLPAGVYTVEWAVTSSVDGHTTRGTVPFVVGDPGTLPSEPVSGGTATSSSSGGLLGVVARWLVVLAAIVLTGTFAFVPLILTPALRLLAGLTQPGTGPRRRKDNAEDVQPSRESVDRVAEQAVIRLVRIAGVVLLLYGIGLLLLLVAETMASSGSLGAALDRSLWDYITTTRRGTLWWLRLALAGVLTVGIAGVWRRMPKSATASRGAGVWLGLTIAGALALLLQSMGSHAAALRTQEVLATVIDWVHLLAVALWIGGLVQLGLALLPALGPLGGPPRTRLLAALIPRFSLVAGASVGIVVLTGIYQTVRLLGGWDALIDGSWGRALLVKLTLFVPLIGLAAVNLLRIRPRLARLAGQLDLQAREAAAVVRSRFRRAVLAEVAIAVMILLVVGVLTGVSPAQVTGFTPEGPFRPFILTAQAEDLTGRMVLSPGRIGLNRFDLSLTSGAVPEGTEVVLRISTLDRDTGIAEAKMESLGGGRFTTSGTYLSTVGLWEVAALVRRPNADEARLAFQLSLTTSTGQAQVRENRPAAPLARGREIYAANCASCHGEGARGDGPLAPALNPRPVDLTVHVPLHADSVIRDWIANGIPRTAMPAWKDQFSDEEIQAIVNYLRQVAEQTKQDR